jgi:hypothetical protein
MLPPSPERLTELPQIRFRSQIRWLGSAVREDACVIQHRLELEDSRRVIDIPVSKFLLSQFSIRCQNAVSNSFVTTDEQFDSERRMLRVEPLDESGQRRRCETVIVHLLEFGNE